MNIQPYYSNERGDFHLFKGDSRQLLGTFRAGTVDLIFADPPYFLTNNRHHQSYKGDWDLSKGVNQDFEFHQAWISTCYRLLKDTGVIFITGTHHNIYQCGFALQQNGFKIINDIIWYKPNKKWSESKYNLAYTHENIIFAKKDNQVRQYMNWNYMRQPQDRFHRPDSVMPDIWDIKPCGRNEIDWHRTPKAIELLERIIMLTTQPNAIILDPFNGSGTTGIATMKCGKGRIYIGIDQDQEQQISYLDKTIERLNSYELSKKEATHTSRFK